MNSDQGSQFAWKEYVKYLKREALQMSMAGNGKALEKFIWKDFGARLIITKIDAEPGWFSLSLGSF